MANEYASLAEVRAELKLGASDTADDALLTLWLEVASRAIDVIGQRTYFATSATRYFGYYTAQIDGKVLTLDAPLLTVGTLTNGTGVVLAAGSYSLEPRNAPPYRSIRLKSAYAWAFTDSDSSISVLGTWGDSATVPFNIKGACVLLCLRLFRRKDAPLGVLGMSDLGSVVEIARKDADVMALLGPKKAWVV